jgi:Transcription factor WhiB
MTDIFFPPDGGNAASIAARAKKICVDCKVEVNCLRYSLEGMTVSQDKVGIYARTTAKQRDRLRRQLKKTGVLDGPAVREGKPEWQAT